MNNEMDNHQDTVQHRTYSKRYAILMLIGLSQFVVFYQHYQYSTIGNVVTEYYRQNYVAVDSTTLICNIGCIFLFYPIGLFFEKYGLRSAMIFSTFVNALGACIKCFAFSRDAFWLLLVGQMFPASITLFFESAMPVLGASWFKPSEAATVLGTGTAFLTLGIATAFLPPALLFQDLNIENIRNGLILISLIVAVVSVVCFVATLFVVVDKPPTPPSLAEETKSNYAKPSLKALFKRPNVVLLLTSFFITNGIIQIISTTFNQSVLYYYNDGKVLTAAGVLFVSAGIPGSFFTGFLCNKYPRYKLLHVIGCALIILITISYELCLWLENIPFLYFVSFSFGFIANGASLVVLDYIIESTYPYPESIMFALASTSSFSAAVIFVPIVSSFSTLYGPIMANTILVVIAMINLCVSILVKEDLRRRNANNEYTSLVS